MIHATRLATVFLFVDALVEGRRLCSAELGREVKGEAAEKHRIKQADRLLGNVNLHKEASLFFQAVAMSVIRSRKNPLILVDWTELPSGFWALVAAVPFDGRSIPIYAEVHQGKKSQCARIEHAFLDHLKEKILPESCRPVIVTDAGFRNPWFKKVQRMGWFFLGRQGAKALYVSAETSQAEREVDECWKSIATLHEQATNKPRDRGRLVVAKSNPLEARIVLFKNRPRGRKGGRNISPSSTAAKRYRKRAKDPWVLITNATHCSALDLVNWYSTRMQVEETFRDTKSPRFGQSLEHARTHRGTYDLQTERWTVLLLLSTLALLVATVVGAAAELLGLERRFQANTIRTRRILSLVTLGIRLLRRGQWPPNLKRLMSNPLKILVLHRFNREGANFIGLT